MENGKFDPKLVKIPGIYVDAVVICEGKKNHEQCVGCEYDGAMRFPCSLEQSAAAVLSTLHRTLNAYSSAGLLLPAGLPLNLKTAD